MYFILAKTMYLTKGWCKWWICHIQSSTQQMQPRSLSRLKKSLVLNVSVSNFESPFETSFNIRIPVSLQKTFIWLRIPSGYGLDKVLACLSYKTNKWGGHSDWASESEAPCHSRCGTMKIPPCYMDISRGKAWLLHPFHRWRLHMNAIFSSGILCSIQPTNLNTKKNPSVSKRTGFQCIATTCQAWPQPVKHSHNLSSMTTTCQA